MRTSVCLVATLLAGCGAFVSEDEAVRAATGAGLKDVTVGDSHWIAPEWAGCGESDSVGFDVSGVNAAGDTVNALVCCGAVLKRCTVRY